MSDIHALTEILDAADAACSAIDSAAADGKLTIIDVRFLLTPVKDLITAFKDRGVVASEIKGIDEAAIGELIVRIPSTVEKLVKAASEVAATA